MGVDEATGDVPRDYFAAPAPKVEAAAVSAVAPMDSRLRGNDNENNARTLVASAQNLQELEQMVRAFNGCALKKTAGKTVFACGNPRADIMIIGDAPDSADDVSGEPFSGIAGELLDKMLAAIGLNRESTYLTNLIFWRPPGNRQPNASEIAACLPFVEKHIALKAPKLLLLCGGVSAAGLLKKDQSISRLRGKWLDYSNEFTQNPIPTLATFHPHYLIKQPAQKRLSWQDLLTFKGKIG